MISGILSVISALIASIAAIIVGIFGSIAGILVAVVVGILVPLLVLGVPLLMVMAVVWLIGLPSARRARRREPDEARLMQEINRGLARMENRLNSLETIMMDDARSYSAR